MARGGKHYELGSAGLCLPQYLCEVGASEELVPEYEW